ncbi:MAG: tRNA (5-methylaminomethyl-2-thiouridine)(34)-methyltransferase MnmD [Pseudomonadota bacterium]
MNSPDLDWRESDLGPVPVSRQFDDPYYTLHDGHAESQHVFLAGNDLPARFCDGFQIAELGFGTGLNLLAAVEAWEERAGRFGFTTFERFPLTVEQIASALAPWPTLASLTRELTEAYTLDHPFALGPADVHIITGDARETLARSNFSANAWFLDGFSPAKNPELWEADLLTEVARHTAPNGTFATYTAASDVRRALQSAGFRVEKTRGYGRKREMLRGWLEPKVTGS